LTATWYNYGMEEMERTDYRKCSPETLYEARKTVIRMWKKKKPVEEIAEATGMSTNIVYITIRKYRDHGLAALKPKTRGRKQGQKRTLSKEQETDIRNTIVDKNPDQLKMKCCLWDRKAVQQLIKERYGIEMPIRTVGEYLLRWGFTVQRPMKQAMNQKPEQVQKWLKEEYPAIHADAQSEDAEIYWGDETAVQNVANYARGYAPKGQTPVLKVQTVKMHINMISAISNQGHVRFMFSNDSIDADKLIEFMERLIKDAKRKIYLILDNLRAHHSKKTMAWVDAHADQLKLFHLPPYSPEYNPDEYLNHDLKESIGMRLQAKDKQELQDAADGFMSSVSDDPIHVQSYFDHPTLEQYGNIKG